MWYITRPNSGAVFTIARFYLAQLFTVWVHQTVSESYTVCWLFLFDLLLLCVAFMRNVSSDLTLCHSVIAASLAMLYCLIVCYAGCSTRTLFVPLCAFWQGSLCCLHGICRRVMESIQFQLYGLSRTWWLSWTAFITNRSNSFVRSHWAVATDEPHAS